MAVAFTTLVNLSVAVFIVAGAAGVGLAETLISIQSERAKAYAEHKPKTVIDLQQFSSSQTMDITIQGQPGQAALINLNPLINSWHLLSLNWKGAAHPHFFHLENPLPQDQTFGLDPAFPTGIIVKTQTESYLCELWGSFPGGVLGEAQKSPGPFASLGEQRIFLRNKTKGSKTTLESTADFLRRYVPAGEEITAMVRETFYQDKFLKTSEIIDKANKRESREGAETPRAARVDPRYRSSYLIARDLGIPLGGDPVGQLVCGEWLPIRNTPGMFVSVIQPRMILPSVFAEQHHLLKPLETVEQSAQAYLVAIDLGLYGLHYAMGTEHPSVDWSTRIRPQARNDNLPGPDGFATVDPLIMTGIIRPDQASRTIAAFTGGFKRYHGAFRSGPLALQNHASHYGFIEHGVILSKLHPGLATLLVMDDRSVLMKTWRSEDDHLLPRIRFARQNGAPLIEYNEAENKSRPGDYVANIYYGNWSGSAEGNFRTLRAGVALQTHQGRRYLIYAYFSTATPSAMALVFQAYQCQYALQTDINALEHTYFALYHRTPEQFQTYYLIQEMKVLDKTLKKVSIPRFLGFPDNRDFFYIMRNDTR